MIEGRLHAAYALIAVGGDAIWSKDQAYHPEQDPYWQEYQEESELTTKDIPVKTDATRSSIPMIIINGTMKMPNISLYITSDTGLIGLLVVQIWNDNQVLYGI